ncbi:MAG TPA: peptidoglycan DD-metalloendopeptidase family protein [Stellaceae bacterium]
MEVPRWAQAAFVFVLMLVAGALASLGISRIGYKRLVADKDAAIVRAQTANADLKDDVAGLREQLAGLARDRDQAQRRAAALSGQADTLRGLLQSTQTKLKSLNQTRQALRAEQAESAALNAQLGKTEADRAAEAAQFAQYKASIEETATKLEQLEAGGGKEAVHRARVRARLGQLWQKLSQAPVPQLTQQAATAAPQAASAATASAVEPRPGGVALVADLGRKEIAAFERALASTGLDVRRMFSQFGAGSAEGGPFVPPPKSGQAFDAVNPAKLEAIRGMAQVLPLGAPLAHYQIGSPFGPRIDPFNHRAAFHTGIDMDAPYLSPVYATGPGTVVYAGYFGDYGKVVEINHGFGIETLYAHLHRCLVLVGEKVAADAEIGLVGTTGRSTGPHVHYEVRVNGQPQDPEKFIELSRLIPDAAREPTAQVTPEVTPQVTPAADAPAGNSR